LFLATLYLQRVQGLGPMITGTAFLALAVPCIAASPLASRLTTHVGRRNTAVAGLLLQAAGLLVLSRLSGGGTLATVLTRFVLIGLGAPIAFVATIATAMDSPSNDPGLASGRFNASQQLGNAVALAAMATLAASWIARQAHPGGYGRGCTHPPGRLVHCRRSFNVTATLVAGGTRTPTRSGPRPAGATSAWTPGARAGIAGEGAAPTMSRPMQGDSCAGFSDGWNHRTGHLLLPQGPMSMRSGCWRLRADTLWWTRTG
jgi:MFS family permease